MRTYEQLIKTYNEVTPQAIDPQVILLCERQISVPLKVVLGQFKYCVEHGITDTNYYALKGYLVSVFNKQTIDDLEAM